MEEQKAPSEQKVQQFNQEDINKNKGITVLSYIGILCFIHLLANKDSKFAQAHAKQGLALFIVEVIVYIVSIIPIIGWILGFLATILFIIVSIIGIVKVLNGEYWEIPLVSGLAKKLNF